MKRRSIRRFQQKTIPFSTLEKLINAARVAPSAGNLQPLEYLIVDKKKVVEKVFTTLRWAGYIAPKGDPPAGKRPVAYIVVLANKKIKPSEYERDVGAAVENILLAALEKGIGTCWLGSIDREMLREILNVPQHLAIDSVVALGYPSEKPVMEEMVRSIKYWLDESGRLHVPKRRLRDLIHRNRYGVE